MKMSVKSDFYCKFKPGKLQFDPQKDPLRINKDIYDMLTTNGMKLFRWEKRQDMIYIYTKLIM